MEKKLGYDYPDETFSRLSFLIQNISDGTKGLIVFSFKILVKMFHLTGSLLKHCSLIFQAIFEEQISTEKQFQLYNF